MTTASLIGPSRDGDQFHYHWAARQCLALLPGLNDLVAVTIEGVSAQEGDEQIAEGEEVIDVGLYYADEAIERARQLRYVQLKHSTRHASAPWTASNLKKTVRGFAARYGKLRERFSFAELQTKLRFEFTTNRPIAPPVAEALADLSRSGPARHPAISQLLERYTELDSALAAEFFQLLSVDGDEPDLWAQRNLLTQDIGSYLAETDYDAPLHLKELVTRKATSEFETNRAIRRHDVLHALKVGEVDLQPAPCQIVAPKEMLLREQEPEILSSLLASERPLLIHADGGVGKSMLALRLSNSVPSGSESVLYDCYGDGLYRTALNYRHRPQDALVQIANELSARGLCHPLIPSSHADTKRYLRAFCGRLQQAISAIRARDPSAHLCIIIDAADNAEMAAQELGDRTFVRELLRTPLPDGVQLALTCRTHRQSLLDPPPDVLRVELRPFSQAETAHHLRTQFPAASDDEAAEFGYLSSANPRVQALALTSGASLPDMLRALGPVPTTVELAIGQLLQRAVDKLKDRVGRIEAAQVEMICRGLAVLRPLVPIATLARISGTSESAVRSFALDLERPLLVKGNSLHFLDEPTETWFREHFQPDAEELARFVERLRPLAADSSYVASTLPQLLLAAGRMQELVDLALSSRDLPTHNPIERRDVELQRLLFALRACLRQGQALEAAKLALKAGGEVAAETRQVKVLQENTHLTGQLLAPDRLEELVARRTFPSTWMGSHHIYDAGLLSGSGEFAAETRSRLRMALDWLHAWARQPREQREPSVDDDDRTEFAMVLLRLQGAASAADFLRRWNVRHLSFAAGKQLATRLVDLSRYDQIDALAHAAGNDVWLLIGLAEAASRVGHDLPAAPLARLMRLLADRRVLLDDNTRWSSNRDVLFAVQAAVVQAARVHPDGAATYARILKRYLPPEPPSSLGDRFGFDRESLLRAYAVEAALRGHTLAIADVAPPEMREQLLQKGSRGRSHDAETFEQTVGSTLLWSVLFAEVALDKVPVDLPDRISAAVARSGQAESRDYHQRYAFRQTAALSWFQILCRAGATDAAALAPFQSWVGRHKEPLWNDTLTAMVRLAARMPGLTGKALEWASIAYSSLEAVREDAEARTVAYLDLARAVLPASPKEAASFFARSVEIASRIGDENLDRWSALLQLARASAQLDRPRPRSAYRLSRAAELTYEYLFRDKYFDWHATVEAVTELCGASALTILSRWRDRRFGRVEELLPIVVYRLIEHGLLPPATPVMLAGQRADWRRLRDIERAVDAESERDRKRELTRVAYRYLRVEPHDFATWEALVALAGALGLELPDLDRLLAFHRRPDLLRGSSAGESNGEQSTSDARLPEWNAFFAEVDLLDAESLRVAYAHVRTYDPPYQFEAFFREAVRRIETGRAPEFVAAVASWPDFDTFVLRYLLDAVLEAASHLLSLRHAIREAVLRVCRHQPSHARRRSWGEESIFTRLDAAGIVSDCDVARAAIEGYATSVDSLRSL